MLSEAEAISVCGTEEVREMALRAGLRKLRATGRVFVSLLRAVGGRCHL